MRRVYLFRPLNNRNEENLHHLQVLFLIKGLKVIKIPFSSRDKIPLVYLIETLQPLTYNTQKTLKE